MSMDESSRNQQAVMGSDLDVERGSDVPISTQIYWQLAYQIDSGRLLPGSRLPPVRELGAALRVNPNTIRAVYRRLSDAGYVSSRHGAGTHVADRPPQRRAAEALAGLVSEMLRRAAHAGFTADEVASATFAAATERKRPGPLVRVLFAECTNADAGYDADRAKRREVLQRLFIPRLARIDRESKVPQRRIARQSELPHDLIPLTRALTERRLLVVRVAGEAERGETGAATLEVAHETLLRRWPTLAELLAEDRDALLMLDGVLIAANDWAKAQAESKQDFLAHRGSRLAASRSQAP